MKISYLKHVLVIVTDRCGIVDFVDRIGYGLEYDKDLLRDAIIKVFGEEGLRRKFWEEDRRLVREEFSWDKIMRKVEVVYSALNKNKQKELYRGDPF